MIGFLLIVGLLIGFIKISLEHSYPLILAGSYTVLTTLVMIMLGHSFSAIVVFFILALSVSWLGFWLLERFEESSVWWIIAIAFPFLMLMLEGAV